MTKMSQKAAENEIQQIYGWLKREDRTSYFDRSIRNRYVGTPVITFNRTFLLNEHLFSKEVLTELVSAAHASGFTASVHAARVISRLRGCLPSARAQPTLIQARAFSKSLPESCRTGFPDLNHSDEIVNLARIANVFLYRGEYNFIIKANGNSSSTARVVKYFKSEDDAMLEYLQMAQPGQFTLLRI